MLNSTSKTVICVDSSDLCQFITVCYGLPQIFDFCGGNNGDMKLFEIVHDKQPDFGEGSFAGYDMENALMIINYLESEYWGDIGSILARLVYDGYLPQGNYLIDHSW